MPTLDEVIADLQIAATQQHDYNTAVQALIDMPVKVYEFLCHELGASGAQASMAAIHAYAKMERITCPATVFRLEDALYPQYDLPKRLHDWLNDDENREWLKEQAREKLSAQGDTASHSVIEHWLKLARYDEE